MHDAASDALKRPEVKSPIAAMVIKYVGKGFASLAASNVALRNAEWALALQPQRLGPDQAPVSVGDVEAPPFQDSVIRFEDALAAAVQLMKHMATQCVTEAHISRMALRFPVGMHRDDQLPTHLEFPEVINASRRFLDYTAEHAVHRDLVAQHGLARESSVRVNGVNFLKQLRDNCFRRGGVREVKGYGGKPLYQKYTGGVKWTELLECLQANGLAFESMQEGAQPLVMLRRGANLDAEGRAVLQRWQLRDATLRWLS